MKEFNLVIIGCWLLGLVPIIAQLLKWVNILENGSLTLKDNLET